MIFKKKFHPTLLFGTLLTKNVRAWVSRVSYIKHLRKIIPGREKKCGSRLGFAFQISQPIRPISYQVGLDWLRYSAGESQMAPPIIPGIIVLKFFI